MKAIVTLLHLSDLVDQLIRIADALERIAAKMEETNNG